MDKVGLVCDDQMDYTSIVTAGTFRIDAILANNTLDIVVVNKINKKKSSLVPNWKSFGLLTAGCIRQDIERKADCIHIQEKERESPAARGYFLNLETLSSFELFGGLEEPAFLSRLTLYPIAYTMREREFYRGNEGALGIEGGSSFIFKVTRHHHWALYVAALLV